MGLSIKQKILLDLMIRSDKIMKQHDIKYFLFGGSTLGALRHEGFIPWDDDIDIILDVENYYKLEQVFKEGPIEGIDLVFFHNDPYWYRSFAMLVNLEDTCYTNPVMFSDGKATGSRIDVMICDYVPMDRLEEYRHDLMLYQEVLTDSLMVDINIYNIKDEYFALRERMAQVGKIALEKELRENLESYATGSDKDQLTVRFWTIELRHYDVDLIYPPLYHNFEGYMLPLPAKPEEQLRMQFGNDWYIIPRQDEFMLHAFTDNYYISGNNYHEDVMKFIDREEAENAVRRRKAVLIERAEYARDNMQFRHNLAFQREMMRAGIDSDALQYKELINNEKHEEVYDRLQGLLEVIPLTAEVDKRHKHIPSEIIKGWLKACVYCGKYYNANKIIKAYELETDSSVEDARNLVDEVTKLANAFQDRKKETMQDILEHFLDEERTGIPECIFCTAELSKDSEGHFGDEANELLRVCNNYLEKIAKNYEVMKLKADILYEQGEDKEAMKLYNIVHENTINGLDLYDIERRFDFTPRFNNEEKDPFDLMLGV